MDSVTEVVSVGLDLLSVFGSVGVDSLREIDPVGMD